MAKPRSSVSTLAQESAAATPLDAFLLARRKFKAAERIDMGAIADELSVSRVTLYRWVGSREELHAEVLWSLARSTLDRHAARLRVSGGERVARIIGGLLKDTIAYPGMQAWLDREGEFAMRLMTRADGQFQPRLLAAVRELLTREIGAGLLSVPIEVGELSYVIVRLIESYVYRRLITGEPAKAGPAESVLRAILR
jgi:AcrR family transcriptional regulator